MLGSVFTKTLYEKRWSTLAWTIAIVAMTLFVVLLFPAMKEAFGASFQQVPDALKAFMGDTSIFQKISSYIDVEVISQRMVFITVIMGVIIGSGLVAGDEGDGTLQSLLAQPVTRQKAYWQKYLAGAVIMLIVSISIFAAVFVGVTIIGETLDWWRMAQATFAIWLFTMVFTSASFALGAATGKRGMSGSAIGLLAFLSYLITALAVGIKSLEKVNNFSPFYYFDTPRILDHGLDAKNIIILSSILIIVSILGYLRFARRDISSK